MTVTPVLNASRLVPGYFIYCFISLTKWPLLVRVRSVITKEVCVSVALFFLLLANQVNDQSGLPVASSSAESGTVRFTCALERKSIRVESSRAEVFLADVSQFNPETFEISFPAGEVRVELKRDVRTTLETRLVLVKSGESVPVDLCEMKADAELKPGSSVPPASGRNQPQTPSADVGAQSVQPTESSTPVKTSPFKKFLWLAPAALGLIPLVSLPLVIVGGAVIYGAVSSLVYGMNNDRATKAGYAPGSHYRTQIQNALWIDYAVTAVIMIGSPVVVLSLTAATAVTGALLGFKFIRPKE